MAWQRAIFLLDSVQSLYYPNDTPTSKGNKMRRTMNHTTRYRCKDVAMSFAKHRAQLVAQAANDGMKVLTDDGVHFHAEKIDCCGSRIVFIAGPAGTPFANGPSITRRLGAVQYSDLFLSKAV